MRNSAVAFAALFALACAPLTPRAPLALAKSSPAYDAFWNSLAALCGRAFEGAITAKVGGASPDPFEGNRLLMHVRECGASEIRIPFHVGDNRSRTWVFTRPVGGLRLKHDHRHEDGSPDSSTLYGGDAAAGGTAELLSFPADDYSKALFLRDKLPAAVENVWLIRLLPGRTFSYALTRPGREFRVDFDLTRSVEPPPPPWGSVFDAGPTREQFR